MAKKKGGEPPSRQVNIRLPADVHARAEETARVLGVDLAQLVRMAFYKQFPRFQREAAEIRGGAPPAEED